MRGDFLPRSGDIRREERGCCYFEICIYNFCLYYEVKLCLSIYNNHLDARILKKPLFNALIHKQNCSGTVGKYSGCCS